ncbi:MAG: c-type cytochrome [Xanthomonadales bacterium]|nr:c-type cytochrome [Xanthomonadales bacterium]
MKWVKRVLAVVVILVVVAALTLYAWSASIIQRSYEAQQRSVIASSRPDVMARGERLAKTLGCMGGCHGQDMEGGFLVDDWVLARIAAPNLTRSVRELSAREFEMIVRQGISPDGRSVFGMPSASFSALSDADYAALYSFIRNAPAHDDTWPPKRFGPMARLGLVMGKYQPEAAKAFFEPWDGGSADDPLGEGEYIARTHCSECHGLDLEGDFAPSLAIAKAYDLAAFSRLMREGEAVAGNELDLMARVSRGRFVHLSDEEIKALHGFLQQR